MTEEEIKQLATDVFKEKVFFSSMIPEEDSRLLSVIFMPLAFLDEPQVKQLEEDKVAAFYEYMDKAGPRAINGYPMFMSMKTITAEDLDKVAERVKILKEAVDKS